MKGTENFFEDLASGHAHQLDEREVLATRLIDFLINDTDRTPDNYRWARFGERGDYRWRPVPRDRDRAFMHADWALGFVARGLYPKLVRFEPEFSLAGLTHTSFPLDRRLLQRLSRTDFEETARRGIGNPNAISRLRQRCLRQRSGQAPYGGGRRGGLAGCHRRTGPEAPPAAARGGSGAGDRAEACTGAPGPRSTGAALPQAPAP